MNKQEIIELFDLYSYNKLVDNESYLVFETTNSMYPGIEIVSLTNPRDQHVDSLKREYSEQGFAVRICDLDDVPNLENYLFDWFFQVKATNSKIKIRYKEYTDAVMKGYGLNLNSNRYTYKYINVPYKIETMDGESTHKGKEDSVIQEILNDLKQSGPSLIIVEAPAGFGKTSTSYELLRSFQDVTTGIRPFFMSLFKDRSATEFYYLLVSQINREFDVKLGDDIVRHFIKQGKIPLILDGFDELLSQDLDDGNNNVSRLKKGVTMLSTLSELLTDNTKIVLTTRKTAILSGQTFLDWYYNAIGNNGEFSVKRYQLEEPTLETWLPADRSKRLRGSVNILNPVLLGYLYYLDASEFERIISESSLVSSYIERLLDRENERQALLMTVDEQKKIYERLATIFAGYDILSDTRVNVKASIIETSMDILDKHKTISKDEDALANNLTNHALLDRKMNSNIGFLNEFVFGTMLGYSIIRGEEELSIYWVEMKDSTLEKIINSFSVEKYDVRSLLWKKLNDIFPNMDFNIKFVSDIKLLRKTMSQYSNSYFDGFIINNALLGQNESGFKNCYFVNFTFDCCEFDWDSFIDCDFINCVFSTCTFKNTNTSNNFYSCTYNGEDYYGDDCEDNNVCQDAISEQKLTDIDYQIQILGQYFQVDGKTRRMQMLSMILKDFEDRRRARKVISQLRNNNYIKFSGNQSHITTEGIDFYNEHKQC